MLQASQVDLDDTQQNTLSISCCHSCRGQILPAKAAGKAGTIAKQVGSGSLLDPALVPPYIQQRTQRNFTVLKAAAQDVAPSENGDNASQASRVVSADSLRSQIASYLLD